MAPQNSPVARLLALRDVMTITNALPEIEALWPDNKDIYTQCVQHVVHVLAEAPTSVDVIQALQLTFASVAMRGVPAGREDSRLLLRTKRNLMLSCLSIQSIRDDVSTWLAFAGVVGDIRFQRLPDDQIPEKIDLGPGLTREEVKKIIADNRQRKEIRIWQTELRMADSTLTFFLLRNAKRVTSNLGGRQKQQVIEKIISLGRLTEAESQELQ